MNHFGLDDAVAIRVQPLWYLVYELEVRVQDFPAERVQREYWNLYRTFTKRAKEVGWSTTLAVVTYESPSSERLSVLMNALQTTARDQDLKDRFDRLQRRR